MVSNAEPQVTTHFPHSCVSPSPAELFEQAKLLGITALALSTATLL